MKGKLLYKLLMGFLLVALISTVVLDFGIRRILQHSLERETERTVLQKTRLFSQSLTNLSGQGLSDFVKKQAVAADARITVIDNTGKVMADSDAQPSTMENHATRPEFAAALHGKTGIATRQSVTTGERYLYVAIPGNTKQGAVRLAYPLSAMENSIRGVEINLFLATLIAALLTCVLAATISSDFARRTRELAALAQRIAAGDFSARSTDANRDELTQLAESLNSMASKLESSFAEMRKTEIIRRDFIANVSHELRTPLTSIQGYLETLQSSAQLSTQDHEYLGIIEKNAARMARLTQDLLALAQMESGERYFTMEVVSAAELIKNVEQSLRPAVLSRGSELIVDEIAPRAVKADADAIHQVFSNLIENALKYGPARSPIVMGAREVEGGIRFHVRDAGEGIAPEHRDRIFERFYRADKSRSSDSGGMGLGLAIAKHIVVAHGGSIGVSSDPGQGSMFFFILHLA